MGCWLVPLRRRIDACRVGREDGALSLDARGGDLASFVGGDRAICGCLPLSRSARGGLALYSSSSCGCLASAVPGHRKPEGLHNSITSHYCVPSVFQTMPS